MKATLLQRCGTREKTTYFLLESPFFVNLHLIQHQYLKTLLQQMAPLRSNPPALGSKMDVAAIA